MKDICVYIILILFPILMYIVFSCYNTLQNNKMGRVVFIVTICTSLYMGLNYQIDEYYICLLFLNIPLLICYFKREYLLGIILSIVIILFNYKLGMNIYIEILKYLCYLISYLFLVKRKEFKYLFFKISGVIQGFFITFSYFLQYSDIYQVFNLVIYILFAYFLTFFCLYLFRLASDISDLYVTFNKISEENKLKNLLFKLTHEIKNPIAVCKGYLDMIRYACDDKKDRYLDIIRTEIDRSLNIMSDFMDYSKVKIDKDTFDMVMLLDSIYDSFLLLFRDKGIKFKYNSCYDELYMLGDYERLKQVIVNIIKNSVEAINKDGIIEMSLYKDGDNAVIMIMDNGIGMDNEEINNIYEMFYTTKKNGTGLGVSLSKEIILAHDGDIRYESVKNKYTKCVINLPIV